MLASPRRSRWAARRGGTRCPKTFLGMGFLSAMRTAGRSDGPRALPAVAGSRISVERVVPGRPARRSPALARRLEVLRRQLRQARDRGAEPSAAVTMMDTQSVHGADTVGQDSHGYDAHMKVNGRKRFVITDTSGLLVAVMVRPADVRVHGPGPPRFVDGSARRGEGAGHPARGRVSARGQQCACKAT